ncbi:MAG: transporter substrate-binding domain-containing protein, partial [Marinobacter sp.]|uniref:substrate-binding periplasmic protein n=1 Tax=Marinobacter sp. TaxID=50741 RepID=UPI00299F0C7D
PLAAVPAFAEPVGKADAVVSIAAPLYWCPYACDATTARWGYTVEIARAALQTMGYQVTYRNLPYDRALLNLQTGRIDATIPTFKGEAPGVIYPDHPVSLSEYCFYVETDESWRYRGVDSLTAIRFVATSGYTYGAEVDAYIAEHLDSRVDLIRGQDIPHRLRRMVQAGRFDDRLLFESSGQDDEGLVNAGCLEERHHGYLALSPHNPERARAIAAAFDRGLERARADGRLCAILEKYGLETRFQPVVDPEDCLIRDRALRPADG